MKDKNSSISRRKFLGSVGCGVAGTVVATSMIGCATASAAPASMISMPESSYISQTLLIMAKDIYPHEMIENKYYQKIVDDLAKQEKKRIGEGVAMLDQ